MARQACPRAGGSLTRGTDRLDALMLARYGTLARCTERLDVMAVSGMQTPDFRTISDFRKRHLAALAGLFAQVLALCHKAGLVQLGHVALDGTKLKANASKHKAMSYGRMGQRERALRTEVGRWFAQAARADAAEDAAYGPERRGGELPVWVADKQARLEKIREAKAALEAEAATPPQDDDEGPGPSSGMRWRGRPQRTADGGPPARAQRNFTDPDSRLLKTRDGFVQGYNGQIAVDAAHQIILAQRLSTSAADHPALVPLVDRSTAACGRPPKEVSGDAGFCTEANLAFLEARGIAAYLPPGRGRHGEPSTAGHRRLAAGTRITAMAAKLRRAGRRSRYRLRKQVVEPAIGQIKHARGFRQFSLRGFAKVTHEWALICTVHNLAKLIAQRPA